MEFKKDHRQSENVIDLRDVEPSWWDKPSYLGEIAYEYGKFNWLIVNDLVPYVMQHGVDILTTPRETLNERAIKEYHDKPPPNPLPTEVREQLAQALRGLNPNIYVPPLHIPRDSSNVAQR